MYYKAVFKFNIKSHYVRDKLLAMPSRWRHMILYPFKLTFLATEAVSALQCRIMQHRYLLEFLSCRRHPQWSDYLVTSSWPEFWPCVAYCIAHLLVQRPLPRSHCDWISHQYHLPPPPHHQFRSLHHHHLVFLVLHLDSLVLRLHHHYGLAQIAPSHPDHTPQNCPCVEWAYLPPSYPSCEAVPLHNHFCNDWHLLWLMPPHCLLHYRLTISVIFAPSNQQSGCITYVLWKLIFLCQYCVFHIC